MDMSNIAFPPFFNSPLEVGFRSLVLLFEYDPKPIRLERLVMLDYLILHSNDFGGPASLHPPSPFRAGEISIRRELILKGLNLFQKYELVERLFSTKGILYKINDSAGMFVLSLDSSYVHQLRERSAWIGNKFGHDVSDARLKQIMNDGIGVWKTEFSIDTTG